jgi:hypothetical protein
MYLVMSTRGRNTQYKTQYITLYTTDVIDDVFIHFTSRLSQLVARLKFIVTIVAKRYAITIPLPVIIHLSICECFKIKLFRERLKAEEK